MQHGDIFHAVRHEFLFEPERLVLDVTIPPLLGIALLLAQMHLFVADDRLREFLAHWVVDRAAVSEDHAAPGDVELRADRGDIRREGVDDRRFQ